VAAIMAPVWIDARGSEVLDTPECHRLLAVGAKEGFHGHLGIALDGAPLVLPVNYLVHGPDVVLRIGEGAFGRLAERPLASFQVDGVTDGWIWSVLVRGLAIEEDPEKIAADLPRPWVAEWGHRAVRLRSDVVTGRRFAARPHGATAPPEH
jgi:hypothetical protein